MTGAEKILWRHLRKSALGARFRRYAPVGPYVVSFLSHSPALIIELVDQPDTTLKTSSDPRTRLLTQRGFAILRIPNSDLLESLDTVLGSIRDALDALSMQAHGTSLEMTPDKT